MTCLRIKRNEFWVSSFGEIFKLPKLFLLISVCIIHGIGIILSIIMRFLVRRGAHHSLFCFSFWRPPSSFGSGLLLNDWRKARGFWVLPLPYDLRRKQFLLRSDRILNWLFRESGRWLYYLFQRCFGLLLGLHEVLDVAFNRIHSWICQRFASSIFL